MLRNYVPLLIVLLANFSSVLAFAPMMQMTSLGETPDFESVSQSLFSSVDSVLLTVAEETEAVTKTGFINWDNPGEAILGIITLLYIGGSIAIGIKYVVVDGYRPKL